ncbi:hypothetical protein [Falsiroseomonas sp.]|uniref:hypothetical protein n=1 Tax=Falsiroseomonas sp. TaxID=2870721 RepID=UPI003F72FE83
MTAVEPRGERAAELQLGVSILAGMTSDAEARRDAAFACMAELLRLGRRGLALTMTAELRRRVPQDAETAVLPPDPPPGLSPATHLAFDGEECGPVWPWAGPDAARMRMCPPEYCAGIGAEQRQEGKTDGWEWAEAAAEIATRALTTLGRRPSCEAFGTFLAWLVAGDHRSLSRHSIPRELRLVWPYSYPEARRFCRPGPDGQAPAETARIAAEMVAKAEQELLERSAEWDREAIRAGGPRLRMP